MIDLSVSFPFIKKLLKSLDEPKDQIKRRKIKWRSVKAATVTANAQNAAEAADRVCFQAAQNAAELVTAQFVKAREINRKFRKRI